jgi:hypothetical protein
MQRMIQQLVSIGFIGDLLSAFSTSLGAWRMVKLGGSISRAAGCKVLCSDDPEANEQKGGCRIPGHLTAYTDRPVLMAGSLDDIAHVMDYGGMQIVVEALHPWIATVHGQQILGEVVGIDGEKRQLLVAAGVQAPDRHRLWCEGFQQIAVKSTRFLFCGKRVARDKKNAVGYARRRESYFLGLVGNHRLRSNKKPGRASKLFL